MTFKIFDVETKARSRLRFRFLSGDVDWRDYGGSFVSKRLNNGDFDYWLIIEVTNAEDYSDFDCKYIVSLSAVAPGAVNDKELTSAKESCDFDSWNDGSDLALVECLHSYGIRATLYEESGNNLRCLMREAHVQADTSNMLFGFYMDSPQNAIGSTGWDTISGDLLAGLHR